MTNFSDDKADAKKEPETTQVTGHEEVKGTNDVQYNYDNGDSYLISKDLVEGLNWADAGKLAREKGKKVS